MSVSFSGCVEGIRCHFGMPMVRPECVEVECRRIRDLIGHPPSAAEIQELLPLLALLRERVGRVSEILFELFAGLLSECPEPWPVLEGLLGAADPSLVRRALELAESAAAARAGGLRLSRIDLVELASRIESEGSPLGERASLEAIGKILHSSLPLAAGMDPLLEIYLREEESPGVRRLAARILDLGEKPVPADVAVKWLGAESFEFLGPYLEFTRAGYLDLLSLQPSPGATPPVCLPSLRRAAELCGEPLLRRVVAELGWTRLNLGVEVTRHCGVSAGDSFPLSVPPVEARVLESYEGTRRAFDVYLFIAHGGQTAIAAAPRQADANIDRFRSYNLRHAVALSEILDVAPLRRERVLRLIELMDPIVEDFRALFSSLSEECAFLPEVYGGIRGRILSELEKQGDQPQLSAELTRLVQMFEEPTALSQVRTMHGLKRYLHQCGLRLGFRLVETSRATNRTVDLLVATPERVLRSLRNICYVDFESDPNTGAASSQTPFPVALLRDSLATLLVHGLEKIPGIRIFCYGNEVHYYLTFLNHPAFLRIDYSPPLLGGMIDLEYYGVSKFELSQHPDPSLEALRCVLRSLEFDVQIESTRIHARYDKERALDIGDLCEKAELLFRLVPFLMDLDWVLGCLDLDRSAQQKAVLVWAERIRSWGVLPLEQLLTRDRRGILVAVEGGPSGDREIAWSGRDAYRDRFAEGLPQGLVSHLRSALTRLGLSAGAGPAPPGEQAWTHRQVEERLLRPLRAAVARGEIAVTAEGFQACGAELFEREHEAERFADILDAPTDRLTAAVRLAGVLASFTRSLRFETTGSVAGYPVQHARLPLTSRDAVHLFVLQDGAGIARLAVFSTDETLFRRRQSPADDWVSSGSCDAAELARLLRRYNYLLPAAEAGHGNGRCDAEAVRELFRRPNPRPAAEPVPGECTAPGLKASPGRAVGKVLLGTGKRSPQEFDDAVLVAATVRPEDSAFLYHSRGIISTGGGILSHAGLIALQFRKPALIISGTWRTEADQTTNLLFTTVDFRERQDTLHGFVITRRYDVQERMQRLLEGDLVVLDADQGVMQVLGQSHEALALHEGLLLLGQASRSLQRAQDEKDILQLRGSRLRARHQLKKLLSRLRDPVLARHSARELLLGEQGESEGRGSGERASLLMLLLANSVVSTPVREYLRHLAAELQQRIAAAVERATRLIPSSTSVSEVLALRLECLRRTRALQSVSEAMRQCGLAEPATPTHDPCSFDDLALRRLEELEAQWLVRARRVDAEVPVSPQLRHVLHQARSIDAALPAKCRFGAALDAPAATLAASDCAALTRVQGRAVLDAADGGFELFPLIGWKAANLAEVCRLAGSLLVPPWIVVSQTAFARALDMPSDASTLAEVRLAQRTSTLREAIQAVLGQPELEDARKANLIRALWERVPLPPDLVAEVSAAYRRLAGAMGPPVASEQELDRPFVAIRSSALEEDAEAAARAGEFDTFLFIQGEKLVLDHLRRAWSGLWTERAIHNRAVLGGDAGRVGGGIIIQRICWSRVSGVLHTINMAEGDFREMTINAGLGLGEGIVSGSVAADQVVVSKQDEPERGPLRFRYVTSDKREQVVFNQRAGFGTTRQETLYHQRLRPALDYVELVELVHTAAILEEAYGYPLDIEFGIEGTRLWILQVRPVPVFRALLKETREQFPLIARLQSARTALGKEVCT